MSKFNEKMIKNFADKLLIGLTEEETKTILSEFDVVEKNMDLINKIDGISKVDPQHYPFQIDANPRDGHDIENETIDNVLKNSDKVSDREIEVPKVVG